VWKHTDNPEKVTEQLRREGIQQILSDHDWRCLLPQHLKCWNRGLGWFGGGICRQIAKRLDIDAAIGWRRAAERACSHLRPNDVDIILATGSPFSSFTLAQRLADRLGKPFVLDYRDLWSRNAHDPKPSVIAYEAELLARAAAVTTVSPSWGLILKRQFGVGQKLHVVPNGYDPEELADIQPHDFGHFAIVYAGNFYPPKRVISPVMAALKRLKQAVNDKIPQWYFHYYGDQEDHVREEASRFGMSEQVVLHGRVPWAQTLAAIRGAGISVVITSVDDEATLEEKGIVPAKVFEALGIRTPVLLISPEASDARAITENTGFAGSFTGSQRDEIASFLEQIMKCARPAPPKSDGYSWQNIAKKMHAALCAAMNLEVYNSKEELATQKLGFDIPRHRNTID
jgi:glycosyltransferase involved in cell wall biosynthesis